MRLSRSAAGVAASQTLAISARAAELRRQGVDLISFAAGEPDFDTPESIRRAAKAAMDAGHTRYTAAAGDPELREALAAKYSSSGRPGTLASEVVVTAGAKQALYQAFLALLDPGDEVLLPAPYWVSFPEQIRLCGGQPVVVPTGAEDGFEVRAGDLEAALGPRTRGVLLNSPNNPTGAVYDGRDLGEILQLAGRHDLWVISDETYEELIYDGPSHTSPASLGEDARSRTVVVSSFSKTYAMTGWRVGHLVAPEKLASAAARCVSHMTSNANSIAQRAALAALASGDSEVQAMRDEFAARRDVMMECLSRIPDLECVHPRGAFYAFPDIRRYLGRTHQGEAVCGSADLAAYLLEQAHVAVVPGVAFGAEGYLRLSYATGEPAIRTGVARVAAALDGLR